MAYDETQNLILNVQGREEVERLNKALADEQELLRHAINIYGQNSQQANAQAQAVLNVTRQIEQQNNLLRSTTTSTRNYQQAALAASFALQDFTSAGGGLAQSLMSVSNNIPTIVSGLGYSTTMVAGLGAAFTAGSLAIGAFARNWDGIVRSFQETTPFAKIAGDLEGMKQQLAASEKEMRKLAEASSLTNAEAARYNELRRTTADLEKKVADEMERQARAKEFDKLKDPVQTEAEKKRAELLKPEFGDPANKALEKAVGAAMPRDQKTALEAEYQKALKSVDEYITKNPLDLPGMKGQLIATAETLRKQIQAEEERIIKESRQLTVDAVVGGKEGAFNRIQELMAEKPGAFTEKQRSAFAAASPEGQLQAEKLKEQIRQAREKGQVGGKPEPEPELDPGRKIEVTPIGGGGGGGGAGGGGGGGFRAVAPGRMPAGGFVAPARGGGLPLAISELAGESPDVAAAAAASPEARGNLRNLGFFVEGAPGTAAAGPASAADRAGQGKPHIRRGRAALARQAKIDRNIAMNRAAAAKRQRGVRKAQAKAQRLRDAMQATRNTANDVQGEAAGPPGGDGDLQIQARRRRPQIPDLGGLLRNGIPDPSQSPADQRREASRDDLFNGAKGNPIPAGLEKIKGGFDEQQQMILDLAGQLAAIGAHMNRSNAQTRAKVGTLFQRATQDGDSYLATA